MDSRATFHPGRIPKLTKEQKRKRELERRRDLERERRRKEYKGPCEQKPRWRILPCDFQTSFFIDTLAGSSFFQKMASLEEFGSTMRTKSTLFPEFKPNSDIVQSISKLKTAAKAKMAENQIVRWKFKRFVTKWRHNHFKTINDSDYITLAPIVKPVTIYHYPTRSIYVFESSSILQDIHKKLLNHCGQIPNPLFPRNPYTNEHFTLAQLLSIQQQCKTHGNASWCLEAFCKSKLSIPTFLQVQRKALRLHAFKSILFDYGEYEGIVLLMNFIESQHEEHDAQFNKSLYRWSLVKIPEDPKLQKWRSLCKEYYEDDILAEDDTTRDECFLRIVQKTGGLCAPPHDLLAKRNLLAHKK
jgi:hypothetical protein